MDKLFKIILAFFIVLSGTLFLFVSPTSANGDTLVVEWSPMGSSDWQMLAGPIFSETNLLPGNGVTRFIRVTNNSDQTQRIAVEAFNKNDPDNLSQQMNLKIKKGSTAIFNSTLKQFFNQGETYLSSLSSGAQAVYEITITFNYNADNDYQEKILGFDILVGFEGTEGDLELPDQGQCEGTSTEGEALTVQNEVASQTGQTYAVITWFTSYKSTSRVVYGTSAGVFDMTEPKYGYDFTSPETDNAPPISLNGVTSHSITINGLTPNTTYYFRCISHASPPTISREFSFTTLGPAEKKQIALLEEDKEAKETVQGIVLSDEQGRPKELSEKDGTVQEKTVKEIALREQSVGEKSESRPSNSLAAIGSFFDPENYYWFLIIITVALISLYFLSKKRSEK